MRQSCRSNMGLAQNQGRGSATNRPSHGQLAPHTRLLQQNRPESDEHERCNVCLSGSCRREVDLARARGDDTSHEPRATSHEPRATSHEQLSMKIYLVRFQFSKLFPIHQFSKFAFIGKMIETCVSLLVTDTVEKVCFSERTNFSRGTGASIRKLYRGTHSQTDFQPAAFVSSL